MKNVKSTTFVLFQPNYMNTATDFSAALFFVYCSPFLWERNCIYSLSRKVSSINLPPSLNAYTNIAFSARLMYSLQQSWNFSNISFCSSVKLFSKSS